MKQSEAKHEREWIVLTIVFYLVMAFLVVLAGYAVYTNSEYCDGSSPNIRSQNGPTTVVSPLLTPRAL